MFAIFELLQKKIERNLELAKTHHHHQRDNCRVTNEQLTDALRAPENQKQ